MYPNAAYIFILLPMFPFFFFNVVIYREYNIVWKQG